MANVTSQTQPRKVKILTSRWAGFPISHADAHAWANRVLAADNKTPLSDGAKHAGMVALTLDDVVKAAGGAGCYPHGCTIPGEPYPEYLILTQFEYGEWVRVNGVMPPEWFFVEGEDEETAKFMLKHLGISHGEFTTCFASV